MPVVEERLSLLEVKMQEVGTTLVRIEGTLASLVQMVAGLDERSTSSTNGSKARLSGT